MVEAIWSWLLSRRVLGVLAVASMLVVLDGCGGSAKKTLNLTFFQAPTVTPRVPVAGERYQITFNLFNSDEQQSAIANVQYTITRNTVVLSSGTVPSLASHVPVGITITDTQPSGLYTYVLTIDPNNLIPEIDKSDNVLVFQVTVVPLSIL